MIDGHVHRWKVVVSTSVNFSKGPVTLMGPRIALSVSHNLESPSRRTPGGTVSLVSLVRLVWFIGVPVGGFLDCIS